MIRENDLNAFVTSLQRQKLSAATVKVYTIAINSFIKSKTLLNDISSDAVRCWLDSLDGLSPASQRLYFTAIRAFLSFLKINIMSDFKYKFDKVKHDSLNKVFEKDQIRSVISWFENRTSQNRSYSHLRDEVILKIAALTGARISEVINLTSSDVVIQDSRIVFKFRNTKTGNDRDFSFITE